MGRYIGPQIGWLEVHKGRVLGFSGFAKRWLALSGLSMDYINLADVEAIKCLKARYFRYMDEKDWENLKDVFTPDVVVDSSESIGTTDPSMIWRGADAYISAASAILQPIVTVHHGHMPEIEITSSTTATGVWSMEDKLWAPEDRSVGFTFLHGYGHYFEEYRKIGGRWFIKSLKLTRLRVEIT